MKNKKVDIIVIIVALLGALLLVIISNGKKEVKLNINCNGTDLSGTYKKNHEFVCELLGTKYKLFIKKINNNKIFLSSDVGLTPVDSDKTTESVNIGIDLRTKYTEFEVIKGKQLVLTVQATDVHGSYLTISFE